MEFQIINEVADFFQLPFKSIQIVGSAKTGFSFPLQRNFIPRESDLDLAIISAELFSDCLNEAYDQTGGYTKDIPFRTIDRRRDFKKYIALGLIHPYYFPDGLFKDRWNGFFKSLSKKYEDHFSDITAVVYLNQYLFEMKQYRAIEDYLEE
jgi:hypothetical protein